MLLARYTKRNRPCSALWRRLRLQRVKIRNDAVDGVGHLQVQGDEIEPVIVFPDVDVLVDGVGILVELLGEEALLLGRAQCVLLEEVVFVHDTDFF